MLERVSVESVEASGAARGRESFILRLSDVYSKTSGRGHKGKLARSGGSTPVWFEGGQTPLQDRLPKWRKYRG